MVFGMFIHQRDEVWLGGTFAVLGQYFNVNRRGLGFGQRINGCNQGGHMNHLSIGGLQAALAVKVPKIDSLR